MPGDEIFLLGFSRGAFTARSIAGLICEIGLLTREGMAMFYPIFKDAENSHNRKYKDEFPDLPFPNKPRGGGRESEYRDRLEKASFVIFCPDVFKMGLKILLIVSVKSSV